MCCQPLRQGFSQIVSRRCTDFTAKGIVKSIRTHHPTAFVHGHNLHTLSFGQAQRPVVFGYSRYHMIALQLPTFRQVRIFYPNVFLSIVERVFHTRILGENRRMTFHFTLQDETLIFHHILQSCCRSNQLRSCAEMIEFSSRKGKNRYGKLR